MSRKKRIKRSKIKKQHYVSMPNVLMAALPNIGGALCSTPQSFADAHCWSTVQRADAKPVEISWDASNYRSGLSR